MNIKYVSDSKFRDYIARDKVIGKIGVGNVILFRDCHLTDLF